MVRIRFPPAESQQTFGSSQDDDARCSKQPRNLRRHGLRCNPRWDAAFLLFYSSLGRAQAIEGLNGFGYTLAELALMDFAVRSTPAGSEGLGFSIMISVRNLALFGTDWFGSSLLDQYHLSFGSLVIANSATTLIAVPLVFLLPRLIVARKDGEIFQEAPALKPTIE